MKTIRFKTLKLLNFKGCREGVYDFGDKITIINGQNGIGKSTIFDAICYVLFGVDKYGNTKFALKTIDADGNEIREIPHEVELCLEVDGDKVSVRRTLTEQVIGDEIKNSFSYYIDGDLKTATDYNNFIDNICPAKIFFMCSSPMAFVSNPWKEQRDMLTRMIGDIAIDEITHNDSKFDFIKKAIEKQSIEDYQKHLSYERKQIEKKLSEIPVRLREATIALPDEQNWDELQKQLDDVRNEMEKKKQILIGLKTGGAASIKRKSIREKLDTEYKRKDKIEKKAQLLAKENSDNYFTEMRQSKQELSQKQELMSELKRKQLSFQTLIDNTRNTITGIEEQKTEFASVWKATSADVFTWDDSQDFCPICGQPIPFDLLQKRKDEAKKKFNDTKADNLKKLNDKAAELKSQIEECNKAIEQYVDELVKTESLIENLVPEIQELSNRYSGYLADSPKNYEQILSENEKYKEILDNIETLTGQLENSVETDNSGMITNCTNEIYSLENNANSINTQLLTKSLFDRVGNQIEHIKAEKVILQEQLDEIEGKCDIIEEYLQNSYHVLEHKVNSMFQYVQWAMFQQDLKGNKKPYCECRHNGIPFSALNDASKINAGLDIARTLSRYFEFSAPVVIDGAESINEPIYDGGQQIRLCVSSDKQLKFIYREA